MGEPAASRSVRDVRSVPLGATTRLLVLLATGTLGLLLVLWSVAVPIYRAVDEPQHLSTSLRLADGGGYPTPGTATLLPEVGASYRYFQFPGGDDRTFVPPRKIVGNPPAAWPSLDQLKTAPVPQSQRDQIDQMTQHPPLWNLLAAAELRLLQGTGWSASLCLVLLRLLQGALLLPLPWITARIARDLGAGERAAGAAAFSWCLVPEFLHIGASITDGDLLQLQIAAALLLVCRLAAGRLGRRGQIWLGVIVGIAILTKAFGLLLLPVVGAALVARTWRERRVDPPAALLGLVLPVVIRGWWYALRLVTTGDLQPSGYPPDVEMRLASDISPGHAAQQFAQQLLASSWQDLGWFETPARLAIVIPIWAAFSVAVIAGLLRLRRRAPGLREEFAAATVGLLLFAGLLASLVLREVLHTYKELHGVYGAQGRYLFTALPVVFAVAALAVRGRAQAAAAVVPLGAGVAQVLGLLCALSWFWRGGTATALAWSPLGAASFYVVSVAAALLGLLGIVVIARVPAASGRTGPPLANLDPQREGRDDGVGEAHRSVEVDAAVGPAGGRGRRSGAAQG